MAKEISTYTNNVDKLPKGVYIVNNKVVVKK